MKPAAGCHRRTARRETHPLLHAKERGAGEGIFDGSERHQSPDGPNTRARKRQKRNSVRPSTRAGAYHGTDTHVEQQSPAVRTGEKGTRFAEPGGSGASRKSSRGTAQQQPAPFQMDGRPMWRTGRADGDLASRLVRLARDVTVFAWVARVGSPLGGSCVDAGRPGITRWENDRCPPVRAGNAGAREGAQCARSAGKPALQG